MNRRPNLVLAAVLITVLIIAAVTWVAAVNRPETPLSQGTPEGAAQLYVLAIVEADDDAAVKLLDPDLGCKAPLSPYHPQRVSVAVVNTKIVDDHATVVLEITKYDDALFGGNTYQEVFELVQVDSGWVVTGIPWPGYVCK